MVSESERDGRWRRKGALGHREDVLEDVLHALAELGAKALEDEAVQSATSSQRGARHEGSAGERAEACNALRVRLADRRSLQPAQVMPQHDAREREKDGRAVREVAEHEGVGHAAVLVHDDEVRHLVGAARVRQLGHDVVTAVDARRVGDAEAQFLQCGRR